MFKIFLLLGLTAGILAVSVRHDPADTLYYNGSILTMASPSPSYVEAVAVRDGKIVYAGSSAIAKTKCSFSTKRVNLQGRTMLPGFIEPHSHYSLYKLKMFAELDPPPVGDVATEEQLQAKMLKWVGQNEEFIKQVGWIAGTNYDERTYTDSKHPTRDLLDKISDTIPVLVAHTTLHAGAINSAALKLLGWNQKTADPKGGVIVRYPCSNTAYPCGTPNGVLEGRAFMNAIILMTKQVKYPRVAKAFAQYEALYIANGFTTVTDGRTDPGSLQALVQYAKDKRPQIDIISYFDFVLLEKNDAYKNYSQYISKDTYFNKFRIAGGKLALDGSLQAFTGWLKQPYHVIPSEHPPLYRGYPIFKNFLELVGNITKMRKNNMQIKVHSNGDEATGQLISAIKFSNKLHPPTATVVRSGAFNFTNLNSERTICVHAQYTTEDQIDELKALKIIPSFFTAHIRFWGDWHRTRTLGPERAKRISVAGEAARKGMVYTNHLDSPIVRPIFTDLISTSVNRVTPQGVVLGKQYSLTKYQAFLAITKHAAYQIFEQNTKGSIEVGKVADFVILNKNPLKILDSQLDELRVLATIKGDKVISQPNKA